MSIASYLAKHGLQADIVDVKAVHDESIADCEKQIIGQLKKLNPGIVGIPCLTPEYFDFLRLCTNIKREFDGEVKIVTGSIHPTLMPQEVLFEKSPIDFVVFGEGEATMLGLVQALGNKTDLKQVKGIAFLKGKKLLRTKPRPLIQDINEIPMPAFHKIDMNFYLKPDVYIIRGIPIRGFYSFTSRGCPYGCRFCVNKNIFGQNIRYRSPGNVLEEIKFLKDDYEIDGFYFYDDTFTVNKNRVKEICGLLKKEKIDLIWGCETRVHLVDRELLHTMKNAGCIQLDFGVESGSQRLLDNCRKGITTEQAKKAFKLCHAEGLRSLANFIFNFPDETEEEVEMTFSLAKQLNATITLFHIMTPYPGTDLFTDLGVEIKKEDYANLAPAPYKFDDWIEFLETNYRFSRHKLHFRDLKARASKEFPDIHNLSLKNIKNLRRLTANVAFLSDPRYIRTMLKSKHKKDYLDWWLNVTKLLRKHANKPKPIE
jgi:radical SAM superfamily enzyme YgiQ (UPF0313 family)